MNRIAGAILLGVTAGLTGCFPEALVVWSPDGQQAAVLLGKNLSFCGPEGNLSRPSAEGVPSAAWLPDSRRLCFSQKLEAKTWAEIAPACPEDRRRELIAHAEKLKAQVLAGEDWEAEARKLLEADVLTGGEIDAVKLYLREQHWQELAPKLASKWEKLNPVHLTALNLAEIQDRSARRVVRLHTTFQDVWRPRVSPDGKFIAFVEGDPVGSKKEITKLFVVPADGSSPARLVAERVAVFPDWSPDSKSVAYAQALAVLEGEEFRLGTVSSREVRDDAGKLLEKFAEPHILAGLVFSNTTRVRCLRDWRILFSSAEFHLPTTAQDMPTSPQLFALDPLRQSTISRLVPRSAEREVGDGMDYFELSPDETKVAVPGSKGEVTVLTLASGELTRAQPREDLDGKLLMLPTWRSDTELCFLVPAKGRTGKDRRAEIVLFSEGKTRSLSADWPEELLRDFGPEEKPKDQPPEQTTQPQSRPASSPPAG